MGTDAELLRRYAEEKSEAAFAELVRLHLNLVYFAALRQVGGDAHRAKDVAQTVFTDLARKAHSLTGRATLTGWLHTSTRFAAAKLRRADFTRQHHEQEATTMNVLLSDSDPATEWERLRPMIDDVIHELDDRDREAVLLRFFENRPFAEIGATLRLSEDAARMRVDRALEKLRAALARRGVKSTSAALAAVFANQVAASAPAGLAGAISSNALANAAVSSGLAAAGAGIFMGTKSTLIIGVVALAAIGSTFLQWSRAQRAEDALGALAFERDKFRAQSIADRQRVARSAQDVTTLEAELGSLKAKEAETAALLERKSAPPLMPVADVTIGLPRWQIQKQALNNLRQIDAARKYFKEHNGRLAASIYDLVGRNGLIKIVHSVDGEDYSKLSMNPDEPLTVTTPNGVAVTFDPTGANTTRPDLPPEAQRFEELAERLGPTIDQAVNAYRAAHGGKNPSDQKELIPFFPTAKEGADFVEFLEAQKTAGL
jgi:RNA polymerase sigma factor (sigma-70 family)